MKKKKLSTKIHETSSLITIIGSSYIENVITQFSIDNEPDALVEWDDVKRFCYRTLSVWALRLALIGKLRFGSEELDEDKDWREFFDMLCDPGIVKVVTFANSC